MEKKELIEKNFPPETATRILSTPLNADGVDKLQWIWNKRKQYDVSTGYTIAYNFFHVPTAQLFSLLQNQVIWKQLWGLKIQTKLQIFLWRAIHEKLPVMHVIHRRFLTTVPLCQRCKVEDETITQCLLHCGPALATWDTLFPAATVDRNGSSDFVSWWLRVTTKNQGGVETLARVVIVCWEIWKARNREVFEGKKTTMEEITNAVMRTIEMKLRFSTYPRVVPSLVSHLFCYVTYSGNFQLLFVCTSLDTCFFS
ncbi:hypothetical protein Ahy_A08g040213 [Arachis hypogaea]|uniref:Reverse transcriptase zinc-binding domain-containing protein n=1 Tax=Arachis hypogaea TaxID=3818 RepID=A0A445BYH9_ARAHY|nr:hypothetical protein Ahy_A08g040213 [Arachis hypogaea]